LRAEDVRRNWELNERKVKKKARAEKRATAATSAPQASGEAPAAKMGAAKPAPTGPVAFVFPGQGSQAVGMLKAPPPLHPHRIAHLSCTEY